MADEVVSGVSQWGSAQDRDWLKAASNIDDVREPRCKDRTRMYRLFEDYYDGDHRTKVLDRAKEYLEANGIRFSENFCDLIVDVMADRMKITGWDVEGVDEGSVSEVGDAVANIWQRNLGDEEQGVVHTQTIMKGDGVVIVEATENGSVFQFNAPEKVKIVYDPESPKIVLYAVKVWSDDGAVSPTNPAGTAMNRMNIYYPDRVEKYFQVHNDGDWFPHVDAGDKYWPTPWTDTFTPDGEPLGVPVFHFANKPKGRRYGRSELRKAIPMQDAYNKALLDVFAVIDTQGFPQRWGTGMSKDVAGRLESTPGSLWATKNPEAKFGQFEAADLDKIGRMLERKLQSVAGLTQTPVHMIVMSGKAPSGESIRASEAGLVSKVRDRQPAFGNAWEHVMEMCLKIDSLIGLVDVDLSNARVCAHWADPETRNLADMLEAALNKQRLGVSKRTILAELGYDDPDAELERSEDEAMRIMERNEQIIRRGGLPQMQHEA